jgi:hypothetical protein
LEILVTSSDVQHSAAPRRGRLQVAPVADSALAAMGDWYHNFDSLGVHVPQRTNPAYKWNQLCKEPVLLGFIQTAIALAKRNSTDRPSLLELFCADGYYTCHARRMGAFPVVGIDLDEPTLAMANAMYEALYGEAGPFLRADVFTYKPEKPVDVLLNCGGLYHIPDPRKLIHECRPRYGAHFMVVQSVVTMESQSPDYFVAPAPGWNWGCRFTVGYLERAIAQAGWRILNSHFNKLEGNERPCDQGSAYFLCEWPGGSR